MLFFLIVLSLSAQRKNQIKCTTEHNFAFSLRLLHCLPATASVKVRTLRGQPPHRAVAGKKTPCMLHKKYLNSILLRSFRSFPNKLRLIPGCGSRKKRLWLCVRVFCGAYKNRTYYIWRAIFQLLTPIAKNYGILIGEFYLPKSQRTSCWNKCTKTLSNLQILALFAGSRTNFKPTKRVHELAGVEPVCHQTICITPLHGIFVPFLIVFAQRLIFSNSYQIFGIFVTFWNFWKISAVLDFETFSSYSGFSKYLFKSSSCSTHIPTGVGVYGGVGTGGYPQWA